MIEAIKVSKEEWMKRAHEAHFVAFENEGIENTEYFDFAILAKIDGKDLAFFTVKELDRETASLFYGGAFPEFKSKKHGYEGFRKMVDVIRHDYKYIGYHTKTKNIPMLKLGLNEKFEIIGLKRIHGVPYVELLLETGRK